MNQFEFNLKDEVIIATSGVTGVVRGRCESIGNSNTFLVAYSASDNVHREDWIQADQLEPAHSHIDTEVDEIKA